MAVLAILASGIVVVSIPSARVMQFLVPAGLGALLITGALGLTYPFHAHNAGVKRKEFSLQIKEIYH